MLAKLQAICLHVKSTYLYLKPQRFEFLARVAESCGRYIDVVLVSV